MDKHRWKWDKIAPQSGYSNKQWRCRKCGVNWFSKKKPTGDQLVKVWFGSLSLKLTCNQITLHKVMDG